MTEAMPFPQNTILLSYAPTISAGIFFAAIGSGFAATGPPIETYFDQMDFLFVLHGFQRGEASGADGRIKAGGNADKAGERQRDQRQPRRNDRYVCAARGVAQNTAAVLAEVIQQRRRTIAQTDAENTAYQADDARFDEKHRADVPNTAAEHFHNADLPCALVNGHDHRVCDAERRHEEGDDADGSEHGAQKFRLLLHLG